MLSRDLACAAAVQDPKVDAADRPAHRAASVSRNRECRQRRECHELGAALPGLGRVAAPPSASAAVAHTAVAAAR
eukprot:634402-Rhodomonas_salina.1